MNQGSTPTADRAPEIIGKMTKRSRSVAIVAPIPPRRRELNVNAKLMVKHAKAKAMEKEINTPIGT